MKVSEIVDIINGKDEKGKAKSAISVQSAILGANGTAKETGSVSCHKPEVEVMGRGKYVQVDLKFMSALDSDLKMIWGMLEMHGKNVAEIDSESVEIPVISVTMVPLVEECRYYAVATNPIFWTIQPQKPGYEANTIRLLFEKVNLAFYESEGLDMDMIMSEIEREAQ